MVYHPHPSPSALPALHLRLLQTKTSHRLKVSIYVLALTLLIKTTPVQPASHHPAAYIPKRVQAGSTSLGDTATKNRCATASPAKARLSKVKANPNSTSNACNDLAESGQKIGPRSLKEALPDFMHDGYKLCVQLTICYLAMCMNHPCYFGGEAGEPKLVYLLQQAIDAMYPSNDYELSQTSPAFTKVSCLLSFLFDLLHY
jgi:hypothetical protein